MKRVAIIGSGPAALMAASTLVARGCAVTVFEKNKGPGHKLLIAGSSGLNISNSLPAAEFVAHYAGEGIDWEKLLQNFSVSDWLKFIHNLGLETFEGTSGRYFVREMKAAGLLRRWLDRLESASVQFHFGSECVKVSRTAQNIELTFEDANKGRYDAALFAVGGGSWQKTQSRWPEIFSPHGIEVKPFASANAGFNIAWNPKFLAETLRKPLKNVEFISPLGRKQGDLMITEFGIEGTPVYFCGVEGQCFIDLKPDLSAASILQKLNSVKENLSPLRRAAKKLGLDKTALALLYHHAPPAALQNNAGLTELIKNFSLQLGSIRPLSEAISSKGGIALGEINSEFQLKKLPGVFVAGEMLDWSAPTGGFLIQACVSQGFAAAQGILKYLG